MAEPGIKVGDEVKLRGLKDWPIAVVTLNTTDHFCAINKEGYTFNLSRTAANPLKTGRRFDVSSFLKLLD